MATFQNLEQLLFSKSIISNTFSDLMRLQFDENKLRKRNFAHLFLLYCVIKFISALVNIDNDQWNFAVGEFFIHFGAFAPIVHLLGMSYVIVSIGCIHALKQAEKHNCYRLFNASVSSGAEIKYFSMFFKYLPHLVASSVLAIICIPFTVMSWLKLRSEYHLVMNVIHCGYLYAMCYVMTLFFAGAATIAYFIISRNSREFAGFNKSITKSDPNHINLEYNRLTSCVANVNMMLRNMIGVINFILPPFMACMFVAVRVDFFILVKAIIIIDGFVLFAGLVTVSLQTSSNLYAKARRSYGALNSLQSKCKHMKLHEKLKVSRQSAISYITAT